MLLSWIVSVDGVELLGCILKRSLYHLHSMVLHSDSTGVNKHKQCFHVRKSIEKTLPSVVLVESQKGGQGSGFIIDAERGLVVTNAHVLKDSTHALLRLFNGRIIKVVTCCHSSYQQGLGLFPPLTLLFKLNLTKCYLSNKENILLYVYSI